jgi:hypothetical protein
MKIVRNIALLFVLGTLSISCERCYECTYPGETYGAEFCSLPPGEAKAMMKDYERQGYTCVKQ